MKNIEVSEIWTYPVKSLKGMAHQTSAIDTRGFLNDRRWMLVDKTGTFLTQRNYPAMALIAVNIIGNQLLFTAPNKSDLHITIQNTGIENITVNIWEDVCNAVLVSKEADDWFSNFLHFDCQLVYMPEESLRQVDTKYAPIGAITNFTDAFPFLLISEASLADLNSRLEISVPMNRFRPNIVIKGTLPYEEDTWKTIRIGEIVFDVAKPCGRCIMTTIDQITAEKNKEPLRTLATYRQLENKILFGQNLLHQNLGSIKVGDAIEVLAFQLNHIFMV